MTTPDSPDAPHTFETALAQLQMIVSQLEDGALGLEQSLAQFEQGVGLLRNCYQILEQAEQKIEMLIGADAAGNPITAPFDASATFEMEQAPKKPARRRTKNNLATEQPATDPQPSAEDSAESDGPRLF